MRDSHRGPLPSSGSEPALSLFKRGSIWYYDFWFQGRRYVGTTRQTTKGDATVCEQEVKRRLRRQSAGLEGPPAGEAPRFQDWAEVHFRERIPQMTRPEFLEDNLKVILRFWGARPRDGDHPDDPYHDLRLSRPDSRSELDRTVRGLDARPRLLAADAESLSVGAARPVPHRAAAGLPRRAAASR